MAKDLYSGLAYLMLAYQRKMRFYRVLAPAPTSLLEQHTLLEVASRPHHTPQSLTAALNVQKSLVTAILAALERRNLIRFIPSPRDRRSKTVSLTPAGRRLIKVIDAYVHTITARGLAPLMPEERSELGRFLRVLADGLGAPPALMRMSDHPVGVELRRISRAQGILGTRYLGTDFTIGQVQVLALLMQRSQGIAMSELCRAMPFDDSTVSKTITSFVRAALVGKRRSATDQRQLRLSLTAKGRLQCEKLQQHFAMVMKNALEHLGPDSLGRFVDLLERVVSVPATADEAKSAWEVRRLTSEADRRRARGISIEAMVRRNRHFDIEPSFFARRSRAFGLFIDGVLEGACQLERQGARLKIGHLALSPVAQARTSPRAFADAVLDQAAPRTQKRRRSRRR